MNEDIKQEIKAGIEAQKNAASNSTPQTQSQPVSQTQSKPAEEAEIDIHDALKNPAATASLQYAVEKIIPKPPVQPLVQPNEPVYTTSEPLSPDFVQKPIRTYESDLAAALGKKKTSVASIAIAENKRKIETQRTEVKKFDAQKINEQRAHMQEAVISKPPPIQPNVPKELPKVEVPRMVVPNAEVPRPDFSKIENSIVVPHREEVVAPEIIKPAHHAMSEETKENIMSGIKKTLLVLLGIVFIGGGLIGAYYLYEKSAFAQPQVAEQPVKAVSIIPSDTQVILTINDSITNSVFISQLTSQLNKQSTPAAKFIDFKLFEISVDPTTQKTSAPQAMSISHFLEKANTSTPDVIARSLGNVWMLGGYTEETGDKTMVLAVTTDYFQNVLAGMLGWEKTMPDDLASLFNYRERVDSSNSSSTIATYFNIKGNFTDKVIHNRDVREFRNQEGKLLVLYSFIDKQTLIVTTTESALEAAIVRIEKQTYVR